MPDRLRLVRAMNAIDGIAKVERSSSQRISRSACHKAGKVGLALDHFRRWPPIWPFLLLRHPQCPLPLKTVASDADGITNRLTVARDQIEKPLISMDDDRSRRLTS